MSQEIAAVDGDGGEDEFGDLREKIEVILDNMGDNKYDSSSETDPDLPIYHPASATVSEACLAILKGAEEIFMNAGYTDGETEGILEECRKKGPLRQCEPRRIGLVGDSGVGKSSLVNCVLDEDNLAFQVSMPKPSLLSLLNLESGKQWGCSHERGHGIPLKAKHTSHKIRGRNRDC